MQLDGLPGGDLDGAGGVFAGDMMGGYPLFGRKKAAGYPQADHKGIEPFQLFLRPFFPPVAIILLVHAMKFHQGLVVFADGAGEFVFQAFGKGTAEGVTLLLDLFYRR